jgi:hypothetical protein
MLTTELPTLAQRLCVSAFLTSAENISASREKLSLTYVAFRACATCVSRVKIRDHRRNGIRWTLSTRDALRRSTATVRTVTDRRSPRRRFGWSAEANACAGSDR